MFDPCPRLLAGFTPDRFGSLPPNRMQVVVLYDGSGTAATLDIHFWNPSTRHCCTLTIDGLTSSGGILTQEYDLNGCEPTGVFEVNGVVPNGAIDGVAFGLYFRDAAGDRHMLRSAGAGLAAGIPNFAGGWPIAWAQTDWDTKLTGITGTGYDAFVLRPLRLLTVVDEYTRECLAIDVTRRLTAEDVLERLTALFLQRGVPAYLRSDNGAEFTAKAVRTWLAQVGVQTLFLEPGSPWENGYVESFNGKLRDELLDCEIFYTPLEAKILVERWCRHYNTVRPHSALGYRPPAPAAIAPPVEPEFRASGLTQEVVS